MLSDNLGCQDKPGTVLALGPGHIHIALITSGKLGVALICLVIANNLARVGFVVTVRFFVSSHGAIRFIPGGPAGAR